MRKYMMLRDLAAQRRIRTRSGPFEISAGSYATDVSPEPSFEVHDLSSREVVDAKKERGFAALAPIMPTSLIHPVASNVGNADEVWGISAVKANTSPFTGEGVVVAVLDTGIEAGHPAFDNIRNNLVEMDFTNKGNGDLQGHGTHCAGTIFGADVNGKRIGIAFKLKKVLIGKVLDEGGHGTSEMIFRGIQWAVDQGAHVISMSLGFDFPGSVRRMMDSGWPVELATSTSLEAYRANLRMFDALMQLIKARSSFGIEPVVVAASGNESKMDVNPDYKIAASLPAAAEGVISVGALQRKKNLLEVAPFSNIFPEIAAPGVDILSADREGGLKVMSGTSMACPHVAGVAALWWDALAKSKSVIPSGKLVVDKLRGSATTNLFSPAVEITDRGAGLVIAPQSPA